MFKERQLLLAFWPTNSQIKLYLKCMILDVMNASLYNNMRIKSFQLSDEPERAAERREQSNAVMDKELSEMQYKRAQSIGPLFEERQTK